jgi:phosphotransferase system IIB component
MMLGQIGLFLLRAQIEFDVPPQDGSNPQTEEDVLSTFIERFWWIPALLLGVLLGFIIYFIVKRKQAKQPAALSTEGVDRLVALFGGFKNLLKAELDGQRLKVVVKAVAAADLEGLRAMGGQGLFVSGNQIKLTMASTPQAFVDVVNKESEV